MRSMTKTGATALIVASALFGATAANAAVIDDPEGNLLGTQVITIGENPDEVDWTNSAGYVDSGNLNGDDLCGLSQGYDPAPASYASVNLHITKAGTFTFRIVDTTSVDGGSDIADDPFLAIFKDFDAENIDPTVVGCNDDENDWGTWVDGDTFPGYEESPYNDLYSWFTTDLEPGNYTVMLTTYSPIASADWVGPQSATFQFWGPDCSIEGLACDSLADTGADATPSLVAGFGLLAAGVAAVAVRRRRAAK